MEDDKVAPPREGNVKKERRPIDALRDSAKSGQIGSDGDGSAISEMISMSDRLLVVKERGIYAMQLADQIDPQRTNIAIPDTQQRILSVGSSDPIVARTLLTAHTLFNKHQLGPSFDQENGLELAFELLKDIVAMVGVRTELETAEAQARASCEAQQQQRGIFALPAIGNLEARLDAFAQKAGHVVNTLETIAKLFYAQELAQKWVDSLVTLTAQRYGENSPFAQYMRDAQPFLLLVLGMRNMIEHPTEEKHIKVFDYRLLPSGQIEPPCAVIVQPGEKPAKNTITLLMEKVTDDLVSVAEVLMAHLCNANIRPMSGMPIQVVELPVEQRGNKMQRMFYATLLGGQIVRVG